MCSNFIISLLTRHKTQELWHSQISECVLYNSTEQSYWYAVGQFYTETKATQVGPSSSVDYKNWMLSEVQWTTHIDIKQQLALHRLGLFLQPISNLHPSLWNIPKQEMADCQVKLWVWAENTRTATWHRHRSWQGLDDNKTGLCTVNCRVSISITAENEPKYAR